jgi:hypothetical protein
MATDQVLVSVYSSYAYAVEPRAFSVAGDRHTVQSVERRWRTPNQIHFLVQDEHGERLELVYDEADDAWLMGNWPRRPGRASEKPDSRQEDQG